MGMELVDARTDVKEPLRPWTKPEVRRLTVNLDTQAEPQQPIKTGSATDGFFGTGFLP